MANFETNKTFVSDRPIQADSDVLGNSKYALGLLKFIESADTPVTIGIQGGWGSGKTSLINILQHHLEQNGETLSIFINAWEHSLFHNENDKSSVAISLLTGIVELIYQVIESKTEEPSSDGTPRIPLEVKSKSVCHYTLKALSAAVAHAPPNTLRQTNTRVLSFSSSPSSIRSFMEIT